jgi:type VI secretion system secreted protein Hcp
MATILMRWGKDGSVKGSATALAVDSADKYPGLWIDCTSVSYNVDRNIKQGVGVATNREAAHPVISKISVAKPVDNATTSLYFESVLGHNGTGLAVDEVEIHLCSADAKDGKMRKYAVWKLTNALVAKYKLSGEADGAPKEEMDISWTKISFKFTAYKQNNIDTEPKGCKGFLYDLGTTTGQPL